MGRYYPTRTNLWHARTFSGFHNVDLIIDSNLRPGASFAISDNHGVVYLPTGLSPLGFHHTLTEAGVTLSCGPGSLAELVRATRPYLAAAYGKLVGFPGSRIAQLR